MDKFTLGHSFKTTSFCRCSVIRAPDTFEEC